MEGEMGEGRQDRNEEAPTGVSKTDTHPAGAPPQALPGSRAEERGREPGWWAPHLGGLRGSGWALCSGIPGALRSWVALPSWVPSAQPRASQTLGERRGT